MEFYLNYESRAQVNLHYGHPWQDISGGWFKKAISSNMAARVLYVTVAASKSQLRLSEHTCYSFWLSKQHMERNF
jgi:hypothetical protein